jgi:hypothetical protein
MKAMPNRMPEIQPELFPVESIPLQACSFFSALKRFMTKANKG